MIAQYTGPTDLARTEGGLLRFRTLDEARRMLNEVQTAYEYHSEQARALAESAFDARRVAEQLLSRSL